MSILNSASDRLFEVAQDLNMEAAHQWEIYGRLRAVSLDPEAETEDVRKARVARHNAEKYESAARKIRELCVEIVT